MSTLKGRRVLVTGAGGFIGSHLVEALVMQGCQVRAMLHYDSRSDRGNLEFVPGSSLTRVEVVSGDVTDAHHTDAILDGCEVVFHLAALIAIPHSYSSPASYLSTNAMGTLNVMQACLRHRVARVVHTSTSECYGSARYAPIDESHPLQGQSPYAATKIAADKIVEAFHLSFGLPAVTLRPFNTFGPRQSGRAIIPTILAQLLAGAGSLRLGSVEPERDFNYVSNTIDGFIAAATAPGVVGETINLGSGSKVSIGELARLAMDVVGRRVEVEVDRDRVRPTHSEVGLLLCDASKAARLLGWSPRVGLRDGLASVAQFIERNLSLYRPGEYTT